MNTVGWGDPAWDKAGVSVRQLDYWSSKGYLRTVGDTHPGSGYPRRWPAEEVEVAARMARLRQAGISLDLAAMAARSVLPVEVVEGVWVDVRTPAGVAS